MAGAGGHNNRQFATLPGHGPGMGRSSSQGRGRGYKNEEHDLIASYARRLAASSPEAVAAKLVEVCGQLGSYSTACMLTVQQQSEASVVVDIYCRYSI